MPAFTITLNNRKILDGLLDTLGVADKTGAVLRALDKLAKIGREKVLAELQRGEPADEARRRGRAALGETRRSGCSTSSSRAGAGSRSSTAVEEQLGSHPRAAEGIANLRTIFGLLDAAGVPADRLRIDLGLARGLDYYTGVVFETTVDGWERFGSIASGGRYDNLASLFTDRRLPGVGASIGLDRLLALMEEAGWLKGTVDDRAGPGGELPGRRPATVPVAAGRPAPGRRASAPRSFPTPIQIGKQMGYGSTRGHKLAVIVGPDEQAREVFNLRDLATRQEQKAIPWADLEAAVERGPAGDRGDGPMSDERSDRSTAVAERPIDAVRGTRDWLPGDFARLAELEALLLDRFARAGYEPLRTPVLEFTELHERKSGAGIVSKLFELAGGHGQGGVCLRPELTAGIVRAYTAAPEPPALPWRVSHAGPVFRYETPRPDRLREFQQVGVERLGDSGPLADAEVIWLADWALAEAGVGDATIRLGHVGLILEMLERSGLPAPLASALIEMLSEAAAEGRNVRALESGPGPARRAGSRRRERGRDPRARSSGPTTAGSTASSGRSSRSSPAGARVTRSSTGCGASGTSATACSGPSTGSAARSTTWPT